MNRSNNNLTNVFEFWIKTLPKPLDHSNNFKELTSDAECYNYMKTLISENPIIDLFLSKVGKDGVVSESVRKTGNDNYKALSFDGALYYYNKSVAFAPVNSTQLAFALGNRAACLLNSGHIAEALVDVQRALQITAIEPDYVDKLLKRQETCINRIIESKPPSELQSNFPLLSSNSKFFDSACNKIQLSCNPQLGRFLNATHLMKVGEVLVVEKPYASVLLSSFKYSHCNGCFAKVPSLVECNNCSSAMFCSTECLRNHKNEHQYECLAEEALSKLGVGKMDHLALRILCRALSQKKDINAIILNQNSPNNLTYYKSGDVQNIFNLVGNTNKRSVSDLFRRAFTACVIINAIKKFSNLRDELEETAAGGFILHLLQNLPCNAHEVTESHNGELVEIGAAAYATLSLLNHSCDPNVVRQSIGDVAVLRAIRQILPGEELVDNYGYHYATHSYLHRQESLLAQYYFNCSCQPCVKQWPPYDDLPNSHPAYKSSDSQDVEKYSELNTEFEKKLALVLNGEASEEKLLWFCEYLDWLDLHIERPWQPYNKCQEAIKHLLNFFPQFSRQAL